MTTPPDFSQSSTPFSLLVPRHPPHALTSLAALFHSLALVSPLRQRSRTFLPARLFHSPVWYRRVRRCCLSLLRLVSCVADRSSAPASAGAHSRANQTEDKRHRIKMQLLAYPSCQRSVAIGAAVSGHSAGRSSCELRTGISAGFRRKSFSEPALRHPARRMLVASRVPVNPSRDFSFRLVSRRFSSGFETSRNSGHSPVCLATCRSDSLLGGRFSVLW